MATLLGAAFVALLLLAAMAAGFIVADWGVEDEAGRAEAALSARVARDAATIETLLDERLRLLALVAAQPAWRNALIDPVAGEHVAAAIRRQWPAAPDIAWVDGRGRVVAPAGDLRSGDDVSMRHWFNAASRGPLFSDEGERVYAVHPMHDAERHTIGMLVSPLGCDAIEQRVSPQPSRLDALWAIADRTGRWRCAQTGFPPRLAVPAGRGTAQWLQRPGEGRLLVAGQRLESSAEIRALAWLVAAAQPAAAATPLSPQRIPRALLAGTLAALLTLPLVLLLARRIARPLNSLAQSLHQARVRFDYDPRRIPVRGTRESVAVGEAARSMLEQIAAQQAAVDDSAAGYRELFELHPLPMWVIDEETLRFLEVNAAAARKYGWSRNEFLAMTALDLRPPEMHAAVVAAFRDARDEEHHAAVWQHRLSSGEMIDVEIASRQLRWGGRPARLAAAMDVTAQHQASLQLQRQRRELSQLAQQLMSAEEAERRELAQVLHDRFAPTLYGAKLSLEALQARSQSIGELHAVRDEVKRVVDPLVQALDASIADTRGLMSELRPPLLVEHGLAAALQSMVEREQQQHGEPTIAFVPGARADGVLPLRHEPAIEYALFMIAHEALHNALRHARASRIAIDLEHDERGVRLQVRDDGCGFDSRAEPPAGHLGLVGIRERARWIGAQLAIDSVPGAGTTVSVAWAGA